MDKKKATTLKVSSHNTHDDIIKPPSKHELILLELIEAGLHGISKLTPTVNCWETSLPTTISELGLNRKVTIARELRPHTHRHGGKTHFSWYWLPTYSEAMNAAQIVNKLRVAREASELDPMALAKQLEQFPIYPPTGAA